MEMYIKDWGEQITEKEVECSCCNGCGLVPTSDDEINFLLSMCKNLKDKKNIVKLWHQQGNRWTCGECNGSGIIFVRK